MSNRYWSKWGDFDIPEQTVGYTSRSYYVQSEGQYIEVRPSEIDDLIYQLMRLKRKVEND